MRRCSRSSAGCISACAEVCGTGSETCLLSGVLVHPANSTTSANATPRALSSVVSVAVMPALPAMESICQFDLLGRLGGDDRAAALLKPAAHPDAAAFELFRLNAGRGEGAAQAPQDDHGESPCPAPPEIHIYSGPALAYRQDLAFHQREPAPFGRSRVRFSADKGAKFGSAQSPRRATRAARSALKRASAQALSPTRADTRAWPCSSMACCTDCWLSPMNANATRRP